MSSPENPFDPVVEDLFAEVLNTTAKFYVFRRLLKYAAAFTPDPENLIAQAVSEVVRRPWAFHESGANHHAEGMVRYLTAIVRNLGQAERRKELNRARLLKTLEGFWKYRSHHPRHRSESPDEVAHYHDGMQRFRTLTG